jgi:DNA-binding transcriptional regulator YiaG
MYHYTESGLQNVWLENGYEIRKTAYGKGVAIQDVEGLHRLIGRTIAVRPRLTAAEFRFLRKEMDLSQRALAYLLGTTEQNVSLWERRGKIPKWSGRLVKVLYVEHMDGNVSVTKMIRKLSEQDQRADEELRFEARAGRWKSAA